MLHSQLSRGQYDGSALVLPGRTCRRLVGGHPGQGWRLDFIGDLVVGVLGALLGGWLFTKLGIWPGGGLLGAILVATVGAVILIVILRMIRRAP